MKKRKVIVLCLIFPLLLLNLSCSKSEGEGEKPLKFAYICKDLNHYWFQQVSGGIEEKCKELGIVYQSFDASYDNDQCIELVKQVIKEKYDGLMLCVTNQYLGRKIGELCEKADLPVIAIDDSIKNAQGEEFPLVSMALRELGSLGGSALARLAQEKEFPVESKQVRILETLVPDLTTFQERMEGYEEALFASLNLQKEDVLVLESSTGMYQENYETAEEYFRENPPEKDSWWLICGANDDCALAPMHVLKKLGIPQEQILSCGLGGYDLSVDEFQAGNTNYITVMAQPAVEGAQAAEMMYEYIVNGTEIKPSIILGGTIATCDNYLIYFESPGRQTQAVGCSHTTACGYRTGKPVSVSRAIARIADTGGNCGST